MALTIPVAEIVESSKNPLLGKHESWGRVLLGDIATIQNGFPFKSTQFTRDEGMPLIRIRDVGADSSDTYYVGDYGPAFIVKAGDLLIGMDGDFNCARWRGPDGLLNQRVCRVILKSDIYHPKLLDYALPGYLKAINDMTSSVTVKHLSSKSIAEIPLPLPPMEQQKRIVAEIEKQFSRLDEAIANLKRVKANLKRYKAAVLKAAVEGRLVETEAELARRKGRSFETGTQLLQRILETRRSKWKGKGKYREPAEPDTTGLPELPEGWVWATPGQLAMSGDNAICAGPFGTIFKAKDFRAVGVPIIFLRHVSPGQFLTHKPGFMDEQKWQELFQPYSVYGGELLITKLGEPPGACAIYPSGIGPAMVTPDVIKMSVNTEIALSSYLMFYFNSEVARKFSSGVAFGTTRTRLTIPIFREMPVAVPPISEQHRIVAEVDRRLSLLRETEAQVDANLQRSERMRQSILESAFTGRIVQMGDRAVLAETGQLAESA